MSGLSEAEMIMEGVRDAGEGYPVRIVAALNGRLYVEATNQGGYDCTQVDLRDLLEWLWKNRPQVIVGASPQPEWVIMKRVEKP